jgi:hypothetical protein
MTQRYIATEPIFIGRARVANAGDTIPESHPKFDEWKKSGVVAREDTKAAKAAEES